MNVENLAGNQFINFAAIALTELPSAFIGEFFMDRIGRRWLQVMCMALCAACFAIIIPISTGTLLITVLTHRCS